MCFVIMPFTETWSDRIYKLLKKIVNSLGYECIRADDVYGSIVLKDIWQKINEAGFIIADLSKRNPNVYYELGIAHTLGKNIIPLLQRGEIIPFNQQAFRILIYEDNMDGAEILQEQLPQWIKALEYTMAPQILLIHQKVGKFNEWRKSGDTIMLINESFNYLNLAGVNFSDMVLSQTQFKNTNLSGASFNQANLIRANLSNANLKKAVFTGANLSESILKNADISNAIFTNSIMLRVQLEGVYFQGVDVENLVIDYATFNKYQNNFINAINLNKIIVER